MAVVGQVIYVHSGGVAKTVAEGEHTEVCSRRDVECVGIHQYETCFLMYLIQVVKPDRRRCSTRGPGNNAAADLIIISIGRCRP